MSDRIKCGRCNSEFTPTLNAADVGKIIQYIEKHNVKPEPRCPMCGFCRADVAENKKETKQVLKG